MAVLKCEMCGGILKVEEGMHIVECPYCGTCQTLENLYKQKQQEAESNGYSMGMDENLLDRAWLALEDREFKKAREFCELALNINARNPRAYLGKLLADMWVSKPEELPDCIPVWVENKNYKNFMRFADPASKEELEVYAQKWREKYVEKQKKGGIWVKIIIIVYIVIPCIILLFMMLFFE